MVCLGIWDYRKRQVPLLWLLVGTIILFSTGIYRGAQGELQWIEVITGAIPGVVLFLVAWWSGKAGYADGIVLAGLGSCLGYRETWLLFCFSLFLISLCSIGLILFRKVHRDTQMPYLSFLAITFLIRQLCGG